MSTEININIQAISEMTATIENEEVELVETETRAIAALREKYAPFAKHGDWILTGEDDERGVAYYRADGKRVGGLMCFDGFTRNGHGRDENRGNYCGSRIYLIEGGKWLKITRAGSWSYWQGEGNGWWCGRVDWDKKEERNYDDLGGDFDHDTPRGSIKVITDEQVQSGYTLDDVVRQLSESLGTIAAKLPERLGRIRQNARRASELLSALTAGKD